MKFVYNYGTLTVTRAVADSKDTLVNKEVGKRDGVVTAKALANHDANEILHWEELSFNRSWMAESKMGVIYTIRR